MAKYDLAFKLSAVNAYLAGEGGYQAIATKFGISSDKSVRVWVKLYKILVNPDWNVRIHIKLTLINLN